MLCGFEVLQVISPIPRKAKNALSAFQDEMKLAILSPGQTRWLTREASIKRVISEYDALVAYFKNLMLTDKCKH